MKLKLRKSKNTDEKVYKDTVFSRMKTKDFWTRFFMIFIVFLFIVTTVGVSIVGFWQATHQKDETNQQEDSNVNGLAGKPLSGFEPIADITKLEKIDLKTGDGKEAKSDSTVTVNYTGAIASTGIVFESSLDSGQPATFGLNQVIKGWTEGVPGMKVGGTRRLLIPSDMAYGAQASEKIPANSDLVFDITLIDVK